MLEHQRGGKAPRDDVKTGRSTNGEGKARGDDAKARRREAGPGRNWKRSCDVTPSTSGAGQASLNPEPCFAKWHEFPGLSLRSAVLRLELTLCDQRGLGKEALVGGAEESRSV